MPQTESGDDGRESGLTLQQSEPVAPGLPEPASAIPDGLHAYKRTPEFDEHTVPAGLLRDHSTKSGVWGEIQVLAGALVYHVEDDRRVPATRILKPGVPGVVEPEIGHRIEPQGRVRFYVEFYR